MMELKLNKESELSFDLDIEGSSDAPKARLILEMEDKMELAIKGSFSEGTVTVEVPSLLSLKEKLKGDTVKGYLEVIVDSNYFVPWEESFSLKAPITVKAESTGQVKQKTKEIKISVKGKRIEEHNESFIVASDFRIPGTQILLEAGDKFEVLKSTDPGFYNELKLVESFTLPGSSKVISKLDRLKIIS